jgi:hypothetical protein
MGHDEGADREDEDGPPSSPDKLILHVHTQLCLNFRRLIVNSGM